MASTKRRKFDNENRAFKEEWIEKYAFVLLTSSSNPCCLVVIMLPRCRAVIRNAFMKRNIVDLKNIISKERKKERNE